MDGWWKVARVKRCKSDNPGATIGREVKRVCSSLERTTSVADNGRGGPAFFGEKGEGRGYFREKEKKERKGEDGTSLGRAKCTPESATMRLINRPSVHTIDNKPYIILVEKRSQKPVIFISLSISLTPTEKFVEWVYKRQMRISLSFCFYLSFSSLGSRVNSRDESLDPLSVIREVFKVR